MNRHCLLAVLLAPSLFVQDAPAATNGIPNMRLQLDPYPSVTFPSTNVSFYRVDVADALAPGQWTRLAELVAPGVPIRLEYVDLGEPAANRFYRVTQVPAHPISTSGPDFFAYSVTKISNGLIEGTGGYGSHLTHFSLGVGETGPRLVTAASLHVAPSTGPERRASELYFSGLNVTNADKVNLGSALSGASCRFTVYLTGGGSTAIEVEFISDDEHSGELHIESFDPTAHVITGRFDLMGSDNRHKLVNIVGTFRYTWTGTP